MSETRQNAIMVAVLIFLAGAAVFGCMVLQKLERIVVVAEKVDRRLEAMMKAAAPVGRAAIKKGSEVLHTVDGEELAESATKGIKEIGAAAKKRMIELLEKEAKRKLEQQQRAAPPAGG